MLASLFGFFALIAVLVTVHEYGHLLAAKQCGVRVEAFSVGFGPVLWSRIGSDGVDYRISAIPLGGYVKMKDEITLEGEEVAPDSFYAQSWWEKVYISFAGPLANLLFSIVVFAILALMPREVVRPVIASSTHADLMAGDRLVSINGKAMHYPRQRSEYLMLECLKEKPLQMVFNGSYGSRHISVSPKEDDCITQYVDGVYAPLGIEWTYANTIRVLDGYPAASAGLSDNDRIIAINGTVTPDYPAIVEKINSAAGKPIEVVADNGSGERMMVIEPRQISQNGETRHIIGINYRGERYRSPIFEAMAEGYWRTINTIRLTPLFIGKMINRGEAEKTIGGPIAIGKVAGSAVNAGLKAFLEVAAMLSISLAVLNLLPIPILDGGRIVQHTIEGIVLRRPMSDATVARMQQIGMIFILALTFFALYNDVMSL